MSETRQNKDTFSDIIKDINHSLDVIAGKRKMEDHRRESLIEKVREILGMARNDG